MIIFLVYWILAYHALNYVWYSKRVYLVRDGMRFILQKMIYALIGGWIFIPWWIIAKLLGR